MFDLIGSESLEKNKKNIKLYRTGRVTHGLNVESLIWGIFNLGDKRIYIVNGKQTLGTGRVRIYLKFVRKDMFANANMKFFSFYKNMHFSWLNMVKDVYLKNAGEINSSKIEKANRLSHRKTMNSNPTPILMFKI